MGQARIRQTQPESKPVRISNAVRHPSRAAGTTCEGRVSVPRVRALRHAMVSVFDAAAGRAAGQRPLSVAQSVRTLVEPKSVLRRRPVALAVRASLLLVALALGLSLSPRAEAANGYYNGLKLPFAAGQTRGVVRSISHGPGRHDGGLG